MLFNIKNNIFKKHMIDLNKYNFNCAIELFDSFLENCCSDTEYLDLINYSIKVVENDIQSTPIIKDSPYQNSIDFRVSVIYELASKNIVT